MSKPLDPSRMRPRRPDEESATPARRVAATAVPPCLESAFTAWRAFEDVGETGPLQDAALAVHLALVRLQGAWLHVADPEDPEATEHGMVLLSACGSAVAWLESEGFEGDELGKVRRLYARLQLASLHPNGSA